MSFENDIFISYAHIDNEPLIKDEDRKGWIDDFHTHLATLLTKIRGEPIRIWRDPKLQGNDEFDKVIEQRLSKTAVLVSILTPRYVKSDWCRRELERFCGAAAQTGGLSVANKVRIFKVIKTPVDRNDHPEVVRDLLGYEFYQMDEQGYHQEFELLWDDKKIQQLYFTRLNILAQDIKKLLTQLAQNQTSAPANDRKLQPKATVYLAETTRDLTPDRDKIRQELEQWGYRVLPEQHLPTHADDVAAFMQENLSQCKLSVHLVGADYGMVPEAANHSMIELQHQLAVTHTQQRSDFIRIVWMPEGLKVEDPRQQAVVRSLHGDPEFLQTGLEALKTHIHDRLNPPQRPVASPKPASPDQLRVYLIYDQRDQNAVSPLCHVLYDRGYEVLRPVFEEDEVAVREDHFASLAECDAVLIYYGSAGELWLKGKQRDLRKVAGYERVRPMLAQAIYVTGPITQQKEDFRSHELLVMKNFGAWTDAALEPFFNQLGQPQREVG